MNPSAYSVSQEQSFGVDHRDHPTSWTRKIPTDPEREPSRPRPVPFPLSLEDDPAHDMTENCPRHKVFLDKGFEWPD